MAQTATKAATQILILDPDREFTIRLAQHIRAVGPYSVVAALTVREARRHLARRQPDLAFIPVSEDDKIVRTLRAKQPGLRLILMTPSPDYRVPPFFSGQVQGVLIKSHLDADLPEVLQKALAQPLISKQTAPLSGNGQPDTAILIAILQQANLGQLVQTAVFSQKSRVVAHWGQLNDTEVAAIAHHVGKSWPAHDGPHKETNIRIQFLRLPARAGDRLLYSRCVEGRYLLTLVALPETPLTRLRIEANQIAGHLTEALHGKRSIPTSSGNDHPQQTFAIVWRPLKKLPPALEIPLRRALERLAATNGCGLHHVSVQTELIHLVVSCPADRDSAWAAYLFKNGSEEIIQQEYGVAASLWETGYYAAESEEPLSKTELNLFLERSP
jgi:DNA-binding NarL/FixJ family response regulator